MAAAVLQGTAPGMNFGAFLPPPPRIDPLPMLPTGFNFTLTNIPGVQVQQYMAGSRLLDTVGTIMLGGTLGYGVVVTTYNQQLYINLTADPRLVPDLAVMMGFVDDVVKEMAVAAQVEVEAPG